MCMACEMFWMEPIEPAPKRKPRRAAAARKADDFACDAPEETAQPVKAKPGRTKPKAGTKSERRT